MTKTTGERIVEEEIKALIPEFFGRTITANFEELEQIFNEVYQALITTRRALAARDATVKRTLDLRDLPRNRPYGTYNPGSLLARIRQQLPDIEVITD